MKKATAKVKKSIPVIKEKNPHLVKLGFRIKQLRIAKGYTSYEYFAYDHGFHRAQFGRYESGKDDIKFSTLLKLANAFEMTIKEFLGDGF